MKGCTFINIHSKAKEMLPFFFLQAVDLLKKFLVYPSKERISAAEVRPEIKQHTTQNPLFTASSN